MIASAASAPLSSESAATAGSSPGSSLCSGSRAPITPVERTSTSSASRSSSRAASAVVASASSLPRSPVAAFATPELITTACGSASARCSRLTCRHAAWTLLRVNIAAPTARGTERTIARSFRPCRRIPAATPEATNPFAAVTLIPETLPSRKPGRLPQPEREIQVLHRLPGRALAEVVDRADHDPHPGRTVGEDADLGAVGPLHARDLRLDALGQHADDGAARVGLLDSARTSALLRT